MSIAAIRVIFRRRLKWRNICSADLTVTYCTDLYGGGEQACCLNHLSVGWGTIFTLERGTTTMRCHSEVSLWGLFLKKKYFVWIIMVPESYHFPHTSHILIHHFLINKCLWTCITLIKLMIKTSHTFAVKFHTNPAVFIQHACRHSVIQKDKLNAQIFSYHIHILCTEYSAYFIAINGLVIF